MLNVSYRFYIQCHKFVDSTIEGHIRAEPVDSILSTASREFLLGCVPGCFARSRIMDFDNRMFCTSSNSKIDLALFENSNWDSFLRGGDSQIAFLSQNSDSVKMIERALKPGTYIVQVQKGDASTDASYSLNVSLR